jgi:uncharacterized protein (TIGR02594 family)
MEKKYAWVKTEYAPKMLVEALKHYGTLEVAGKGSNPNILRWAAETGVSGWYKDDDIPWCGLFIGIVAKRAGYPFAAGKILAARRWLDWGNEIAIDGGMLGDVLIFSRGDSTTSGHVGMYIGESDLAYLVYGGNQSNKVGFTWIAKTRLIGVRRPKFQYGQPANVRKIHLTLTGEQLSTNEA